VPSVCRRIVVLLVVALVGAGGPVASALAQGAGDQQYQDPFGSSDSGSGSSGSSGSKGSSGSGSGSSDGSLTPLSPSPQTSGGSGSSSGAGTTSGSAGSSATPTTTSPATAGTLPNTGLDTRLLLLAGAVLLLAGVGLRMRNAPERF
jgi:LPXTG-motif cell wall-anchored protein